MEIKDLAGLSQPLTKLIEVVSNGIGAVSKSYLIKKNAQAKAEEIKLISDALNKVNENHALPVDYDNGEVQIWQKPEDNTLLVSDNSIKERAEIRTDFKERKKQSNIENVTSIAAAELINEEQVSEDMPDEDWVTRFFNYAEEITSEEMQELWGRILAGEVKKPGTYSLKTLDFFRNISKYDASIVEDVSKFALNSGSNTFIAMCDKKWMQDERNIFAGHQFDLGELGVVYPTDLQVRFFRDENVDEEVIVSENHILVIHRNEIKNELQLPIWKYTKVGQELLSLTPKTYDQDYLEKVGEFFTKRNGKATIGRIKYHTQSGQIHYDILKKF